MTEVSMMWGWASLRAWRSHSREWPTRMVSESMIWTREFWIVERRVVVLRNRSSVIPDHLLLAESFGGGVRGEIVGYGVVGFDELVVECFASVIDEGYAGDFHARCCPTHLTI